MAPLLFIFDLFSDMNLILKIFVFMTLVSWVKNHLGSGALSWILIAGLTYFVLFDGWAIFGPIYILYMLLMFGISGIIIDFFFIGAGGPPPAPEEGMESPVSSGVDIQKRMQEHAAHNTAARMMRR
ncbi:Uncharacterised protein [uncultured archaeon]|nr:Uncharacterised protein [uncultured archaeon]